MRVERRTQQTPKDTGVFAQKIVAVFDGNSGSNAILQMGSHTLWWKRPGWVAERLKAPVLKSAKGHAALFHRASQAAVSFGFRLALMPPHAVDCCLFGGKLGGSNLTVTK